MQSLGKILIIISLIIVIWSLYIFIKYFAIGGDNSYTPYTGFAGLVILIVGIKLQKR
jgi:hypothetical protein